MRKVILFIAMSLDGYIVDKNGGGGWLGGQDETSDADSSYLAFTRDIDTVIMGWNTYDQIVTELSPNEWVYQGMQTYVVTHRACENINKVIFTEESPCDLVSALKRKEGRDIWICGGADIIAQLMDQDLIDQYFISVIPTILGKGIRLFLKTKIELKLNLIQTQSFHGIVNLVYERR